jgi:serine/threonine protein kinase/tetratricopeptide (TPR) repeat protein
VTPERWQAVKLRLNEALGLGATERNAFLQRLAVAEPELHREVDSLLRAHEAQQSFLETPYFGDSAMHAQTAPGSWVGRRLGPYQLAEQIGEGGMGAVYRAVRADGLYDRQVAVKLIRSDLSREFFLRRFDNERQILARLDHPNIARLLDGGASEEGVPYVVMEFVDGEPIDDFCLHRRLSVRDRLVLFRSVCAAVQYAHQLLIVHRDLKPGNILVTQNGEAKLLDFGIAKILDPRQELDVERSLTVLPIMTPDFASPEQVRGAGITTSSDVYSLGVILYLLLTGQRPYRTASRSAHDVMKAVCDTEPDKPSTAVIRGGKSALRSEPKEESPAATPHPQGRELRRLGQLLKGDLDSVVLKALRKNPHDRYATVYQLSQDISRYLDGLPVGARRGTTGYRLRKFVKRHAAGVAVAAGVAALLIAAAFISLREAQLARTQEARAERRFNDVRELAGSLVFDVHDAIRDLPGSTPARKLLIDRALKYLDSLSKESANEQGLMHELAAAYERVGEVQGHFLQNNLGDAAQSLDSYLKALALRQRLVTGNPHTVKDQLALAGTHRMVANQLWATGDLRSARDHIDQAISITGTLPQDMAELTEESAEYNLQAELLHNTEMGGLADTAAALESARNEERVVARMISLAPNNSEVQQSYQLSVMKLGDTLQAAGDRRGALDAFKRGFDLAQQIRQSNPTTKMARRAAVALVHMAIAQDLLGDAPGSLQNTRGSLEIYQQLANADPKNELMQRGLAIGEMNLGTLLAMAGDRDAGRLALDQSLSTMKAVVAGNPRNIRHVSTLAGLYEGRGDMQLHWRETDLAALEYAKACELYDRARLADEGDAGDRELAAECRTRLGQVSLLQRRTDAAANEYQRALELLKPALAATNPEVDALYIIADSYAGLGDVEIARTGAKNLADPQAAGHWQRARTWFASSLDIWLRIPPSLHTRSPSQPVEGPPAVADKLRRCDAALLAAGHGL